MSYYYVVEIADPTQIHNLDEMAFSDFESTGVEEFSLDEPRVDEILGERSYSGGDLPDSVIDEVNDVVTTEYCGKKYYFSEEKKAQAFKHYCLQFTQSITLERYVQEDWNSEWKKHYKPIQVNDELVIIPDWETEYSGPEEHKLFIRPGMGFGTGSHETTFLCLKFFTEYIKKNESIHVLDFGSGSGILGLATLLYNHSNRVDLYDIDPEAMINVSQNVSINQMENLAIQSILPAQRDLINKKYDVVFANILENVLTLEVDYLSKSLNKGGALILSGLLNEQAQGIKTLYESNGLTFVKEESRGDWSVLEFTL
jgi:ribosomal protein L11 methyltransferase